MTISSCIAALQKFPGTKLEVRGSNVKVFRNNILIKELHSAADLNRFTQTAIFYWTK